ncbi:hypothetical protein Tco_1029261 [Tanacetum coccineum]|uniref:Uncharacterized protein n=1 Tax=Tanacetum coccineum TaxID=301880 RepID=A0ABQ5G4C3_9ASTR
MAGLPRMGKARRKTQVATFFSIAKAVLATNGIIAVGDGKGLPVDVICKIVAAEIPKVLLSHKNKKSQHTAVSLTCKSTSSTIPECSPHRDPFRRKDKIEDKHRGAGEQIKYRCKKVRSHSTQQFLVLVNIPPQPFQNAVRIEILSKEKTK